MDMGSGNIVLFRSRAELGAESNLREFVRFARDELTIFGHDLPFDDDSWDITSYLITSGKRINRRRVSFTQFSSDRTSKAATMGEPFLSFAKAFLRYEQVLHPVDMSRRIAALRVLEATLAATGAPPNPIHASPDTFNRAVGLLTRKYSPKTAYHIARMLERIVVFLIEHRLVIVRFQWKSFLTPPLETADRIGREFDQRREKKLPNKVALEALADIYCEAKQPEDVVPTATLGLLLCAPSRIGEALSLPDQCEHWARDPETGEKFLRLRWWPSKGADPMLKDVIPCMMDLAKESLEKIRTVTEPARTLARWYDKHPNQIYLPRELEYLRKQEWLNMIEVASILGLSKEKAAYAWCCNWKIERSTKDRLSRVRFRDVERRVLKQLPLGFPMIPGTELRYRDALFVVRKYEFNPRASTSLVCFDRVRTHQILEQIQFKNQKKRQKGGLIFGRHGISNPDGSPIGLTSHQIRHLLNTSAQEGGLSQIEIAKWSGRKDVRQNEAYDHLSAQEMLDKIRNGIGNKSKIMGPLADLPNPLPILREEFAELRAPTALTTDIGACAHDYVMETCQRHANCLDCEDHFFVKNDETRSTIATLCEQAELLFQMAEKAEANAYAGSNRWLDKHRATYTRLKEVLSILEDPSVPDGTPFHLPPVKGSPR